MELNSVRTHSVKQAQTLTPVHPLIRDRWSARSFSERNLTDEVLRTLVEAAMWSPSSMNEQPWRYTIARKGTEAFENMASCLSPGNQIWARNAPVLVLSTAETHHSNGHLNAYAWYDTGAANQTLLLQAASMGILGHLMGGFNAQQAVETFQIPETRRPVVFIALGYPDEPEKLEEPFHTRELTPRSRKSIEDILELV